MEIIGLGYLGFETANLEAWRDYGTQVLGIVIMSAAAWLFSWYKYSADKGASRPKNTIGNADFEALHGFVSQVREAGCEVAIVHARTVAEAEAAVAALRNAYTVGPDAPDSPPVILERLRAT